MQVKTTSRKLQETSGRETAEGSIIQPLSWEDRKDVTYMKYMDMNLGGCWENRKEPHLQQQRPGKWMDYTYTQEAKFKGTILTEKTPFTQEGHHSHREDTIHTGGTPFTQRGHHSHREDTIHAERTPFTQRERKTRGEPESHRGRRSRSRSKMSRMTKTEGRTQS